MSSKGSKTISISIPVELSDWLDSHEGINRSKLFQDAVLNIINNKQKITPLFLLASVMGICFSTLLIIASIGLSFWLGLYMSTTMFIMGVALLGITIVSFLRVRKNALSTDAVQ